MNYLNGSDHRVKKITNGRVVMSLPVSHKYLHFYMLIGLFESNISDRVGEKYQI